MFSSTSIFAYLLGLLTFILAPRLFGGLLRLFGYGPPPRKDIYGLEHGPPPRKDIYGLEHALLNMKLPPETMWMNMGYWKNTSDFPTACENLLQLLLEKSQLLETPPSRAIRIWDLGFGCGDQTIALCAALSRAGLTLSKYDGLTINRSQYLYARARIQTHTATRPYLEADDKEGEEGDGTNIVDLHLADASRPELWPVDASSNVPEARWTLALDTLYHFRPSRAAALRHVSRELGSSLVAFDLLRSGSATVLQRVLLRLVCAVTQIPYSNMLTEDEYRGMLVAAGYAAENITVCDVTGDVFPGLERFIRARGEVVRDMGVLKGWGGFGAVGKVVGWWGRSGAVRGCVVVARRT